MDRADTDPVDPAEPAAYLPSERVELERRALCDQVGVEGGEAPQYGRLAAVFPSVFRIELAAAATVAACTTAVSAVAAARTGATPVVSIDGRAAQISFRSERYLRRDGEPLGDLWSELSGDYRCRDGWIKVHANFDHHGASAAAAMGVAAQRAALEAALAGRDAASAERAIIDAGGAAGAMRRAEQWADHPQGAWEATQPPVRLRPIDDAGAARPGAGRAAARRWPTPTEHTSRRPLEGLRVLDLTRVIAGPVCGRVLSGHGADVLSVSAAHLPQVAPLLADTGFGKRSSWLDLRHDGDRAAFERLVAGADALVESYRPGALEALGYGPQRLAALSPGLVVVDVRAYSSGGVWAGRRGFDSLVQMVSGIAAEGAAASGVDHPVALPCQALDHATGWLAAFGLLAGLLRQRAEGGSWRVEVALASTAAWLDALGRHPAQTALQLADPGPGEVADLLVDTPSPDGVLRHVALPGRLDGAAPRWSAPPPRPGSSPPLWS